MPEYLDNHKSTTSEKELGGGVKGRFLLSQPSHHLYASNVARAKTTLSLLPPSIRDFVEKTAEMCRPAEVHICDGSEAENRSILEKLKAAGTIRPLPKYQNCWLARTDPRDVARVESRTFISTKEKRTTVPEPRDGVKGQLGNWMSLEDMDKAIKERFPNCMKNRTMYVIPFSMGPLGSPLAKSGLQITDSPYVVASMRVMTRVSLEALTKVKEEDVVRALHSVGGNCLHTDFPNWPCDPERTIILHKPETNEIVSYGSGYGGNSLLGKKCFALRIGSTIAHREGWLAEHMLILGVTSPSGKKSYIAAAFPSACGKTNLAMMQPSLPGYKVECVGDDIAWIKYNPRTRMLHAINPERGFFGVAPGTSMKTNPNAMGTIFKNTIFTNVAETSDGGVWWEGMEEPEGGVTLTDWLGKPYNKEGPAAHPNSRFCSPAEQCPIIDPRWEDPEGVPLSAILFGGRRPQGVPLVYQANTWDHGVLVGASMRSEATAAAEHKGKMVMNDPFAMRPFFGYNFGHYLQHWLSLADRDDIVLPQIFHVNWFRKGSDGKFLWPGFGENIRVLDWVLRRVSGEVGSVDTPVGQTPRPEDLNMSGLSGVNMEELLSVPKDFWKNEVTEIRRYFKDQLPEDLPKRVNDQLNSLEERVLNS